jgi:hypothetical protein
MPPLGESVPIFSATRIEVPAFGTSKVENFTKRIAWDSSKFKLIKAVMSVRSSQPYRSGAEIHVNINGQREATLNWNANEVEERAIERDVTAFIKNGDNKFVLEYRLAFGTLVPQIATVSASIGLTFEGVRIGSGSPISSGGLRDDNIVKKVLTTVQQNVVVVVGSVIAAGIGVVIIKSALGGPSLRGVGRIVKVISRR